MAQYLPAYDDLVDAIQRAHGDRDAITIALGEIADVWPTRILPDVLTADGAERKLDWRRNLRANNNSNTPNY